MQEREGILICVNNHLKIFKEFITVFSTILIILNFNKIIFSIIIVVPIIEYIFSLKLIKEQYHINMERTDKERKKWYTKYLMTMGDSFKKLKNYRFLSYIIKKYDIIMKKIIFQYFNIKNESYFKN
ncbi:MAG: hypothetical protein PEPC_00776 [Peptostreptococcus russellii]